MLKVFRTRLIGTDDSGNLRDVLPPFDQVVADITLLDVIAKLDSATYVDATVRGPDGTMVQLKEHSESVRYNLFVPILFMWSYLVLADDVPDEFEGVRVAESVMFTLKALVKVLEEESDDTLRLLGWLRGRELCETMEEKLEVDHWVHYANIWVDCGEAFCLSGNFSEAKETLERGLVGCEARRNQPGVDIYILRCHIHLSLALDRLQADPVAQKEHTDWAVKQLRKAPTRVITKAELEQYLQPPLEEQVHPVLAALGGKSWLKKVNARAATGVQSLKAEERSAKSCHACGVRDVQKSLSRCARCQYHYYCSKACQKADWGTHKGFCKSRSEFLKMLEAQKKEDPVIGQKFTDWDEWLETPSTHRRDARISALGVHRDPSRGQTHILMEGAKYTPEASNDPRFKFTIVSAGVFLIEDALVSIERSLDLAPGEGRSYVQEHIAGAFSQLDEVMGDGDCPIPMVILSMCSGIKPGVLITQMGSSLALSNVVPYNPEWRKSINGTLGVVSDPMELRYQPDVKDAEKDFEEGSE
ncbi:hypothetical protein PENSPDRAFT_692538 [Peniophora sp. CONT]|nr:hypothetical protein PENSPDRAFT_692538 [Peniophora sp. CONT]